MKRKIIAIILILTFFGLNINSYATQLEDQKKAAEESKSQSEKELKDIIAQKNTVQEEVAALNQSIVEVQSQLSDLEDQIEVLSNSIEEKQEELNSKQKLLDERLSAVYMNGENTYLEALFSGGIINFISNYDMIKQIAEYDNNLINEVKQVKADLENSKSQLEKSKEEVKVKESELKSQKAEREEKVKSLSEEEQATQAKIEEKEAEIAKINAAVKEEQRRIEEEQKKAAEKAAREAAAREAAAKAAANSNSSSSSSSNSSSTSSSSAATTSYSSASMTWPTRIAKRVNSIYAPGGRSDTSGYIGTAHKGVDINAPSGTPIYAAQAGTVVYVNYSGYGGGWGLYVVIYHGKDSSGRAVYTRYAHASSIASGISVGTKVSTGTVIMYAGATGAAEGAHLHFEVCLNSKYNQVNPCPYLGIPNLRGTY